MKLAFTREGTLFFAEGLRKNSDRMCPLLSCDSTVNNRDVRSTWPRPLTALVKLLSSTLVVRRMRDRMPVARLWGWKMITQLWQKSAKSGGVQSLSISSLTNGVSTIRTMKSGCMITWFSSGTNNIGCFHQKVRDSNAMILRAMFRQVIFGRYMCVEDSIDKIIIFAAHTKITIYIKYFLR